jgi:streptogramin lyase
MSEFITGLRGDLVRAAEAFERRGRFGRVNWPLRRRVWTPAAIRGGLAVAACAVAVLVAVIMLATPPASEPGRLRISAIVRVGGDPTDAVVAGGSVWIGDASGGVTRVDARRAEIIGRVPTRGGVPALATGERQLWVARLSKRNTATLLRLDPATGRITARIPTGVTIGGLLVSHGHVWFSDLSNGTLTSVDSASGRVTARIRAVRASHEGQLAANASTVWWLGSDGTLTAIDGVSGATVARVRHAVPVVTSIMGPAKLAADANGVWISDPDNDTVTRVEGDRITRRITIGPRIDRIATTQDTLWVTYGNQLRGRTTLAKVDTRSGRIVATVSLGLHRPTALAPDDTSAWAVGIDGNALLIRP